jgi:hypothetical protein
MLHVLKMFYDFLIMRIDPDLVTEKGVAEVAPRIGGVEIAAIGVGRAREIDVINTVATAVTETEIDAEIGHGIEIGIGRKTERGIALEIARQSTSPLNPPLIAKH